HAAPPIPDRPPHGSPTRGAGPLPGSRRQAVHSPGERDAHRHRTGVGAAWRWAVAAPPRPPPPPGRLRCDGDRYAADLRPLDAGAARGQHRAPHSRRHGVLRGRRNAPTVGRPRPAAAGGAADARDPAHPPDEMRCADDALRPRQSHAAREWWRRGPPHRDSRECRAGPRPDGTPEYFCVRSDLTWGPGLSARGGRVAREPPRGGLQRYHAPVPAPEEGTSEPQSTQERASGASGLTGWRYTKSEK